MRVQIHEERQDFRNRFVRFNDHGRMTCPRRLVEPTLGEWPGHVLVRSARGLMVGHLVEEADVPGAIRAISPPVPTIN